MILFPGIVICHNNLFMLSKFFAIFCIRRWPNINSNNPSKLSCQRVLVTTPTPAASTENIFLWHSLFHQRGQFLRCLHLRVLEFWLSPPKDRDLVHNGVFFSIMSPKLQPEGTFNHHPLSGPSVALPQQQAQFLLAQGNCGPKFLNRKQEVLTFCPKPGPDEEAPHLPPASCLGNWLGA